METQHARSEEEIRAGLLAIWDAISGVARTDYLTESIDRKLAALTLLAPGSPALARLLGRPCSSTRIISRPVISSANGG